MAVHLSRPAAQQEPTWLLKSQLACVSLCSSAVSSFHFSYCRELPSQVMGSCVPSRAFPRARVEFMVSTGLSWHQVFMEDCAQDRAAKLDPRRITLEPGGTWSVC